MRIILLFVIFLASPHVWAEQKPLTAEALLKGCEYTLLLAEGKKLSAEEMALSAQATSMRSRWPKVSIRNFNLQT
jgi:hypothetical protein